MDPSCQLNLKETYIYHAGVKYANVWELKFAAYSKTQSKFSKGFFKMWLSLLKT